MTDVMNEKIMMIQGDHTPQLTKEEKDKTAKAYFDLFYGLSAAQWAKNPDMTLGEAWYAALGQIKSMLGTRDKNNPATAYMQQMYAAHNARWSRVMMTSPNKDKKLELNPEQTEKWKSSANKRIGDAMKMVNDITAKHKPQPQPEITKTHDGNGKKFTAAQQKVMQLNLIMKMIAANNQNQRAA